MSQREILFRGREILGGPWHEGFYLRDGARAWILSEGIMDLNATQILPETIGQYTGLDDKNGVKVFEGDVVRVQAYFEDIEVKFESSSFCAYRKNKGLKENIIVFLSDIHPSRLEVIGNIHDNPNILNQES